MLVRRLELFEHVAEAAHRADLDSGGLELGSQAHGGPRIVHGPLALDTVARRAFLKNEPLELAAREWAVLEVLLGKVEKIVSKEAIIQAVAGWGDDLSPNAIEVYVSRLRSKLEPAGIKIRTVRGFGYMLEEFKTAH